MLAGRIHFKRVDLYDLASGTCLDNKHEYLNASVPPDWKEARARVTCACSCVRGAAGRQTLRRFRSQGRRQHAADTLSSSGTRANSPALRACVCEHGRTCHLPAPQPVSAERTCPPSLPALPGRRHGTEGKGRPDTHSTAQPVRGHMAASYPYTGHAVPACSVRTPEATAWC